MLPYQQSGGCEPLPEAACGGGNLAVDSTNKTSEDVKNRRAISERELALISAAERLEQLGIQFERILKRSRSAPETHGDMSNKRPKPLSLSRNSLSDPTRTSAFSPGSSFSQDKSESSEDNYDDERWKALDLHLLASVATSPDIPHLSTRFSPHIINHTPNLVVAQPAKRFLLDWLHTRVHTVLDAIG